MAGKSRHAKGKHLPRSKKRKAKRGSSSIAAQRQAVAETYEPVSRPKVSAPSVSVPTSMATQTAARYPYIIIELRRIAILAGITLAILVVLALVLS